MVSQNQEVRLFTQNTGSRNPKKDKICMGAESCPVPRVKRGLLYVIIQKTPVNDCPNHKGTMVAKFIVR